MPQHSQCVQRLRTVANDAADVVRRRQRVGERDAEHLQRCAACDIGQRRQRLDAVSTSVVVDCRPLYAAVCGGFAAVAPAERRYRSIAARRVCSRCGRLSIRICSGAVGRSTAISSRFRVVSGCQLNRLVRPAVVAYTLSFDCLFK